MKRFLCGLLLILAAHSYARADGQKPEYCVDFSADACARIRAVVESKVRPAYCVPGFARADSGLHLTDEQLRICYAMADVPKAEVRRKEMVEDAEAMVKENWAQQARSIEAIIVGYKCDVVDEVSASVAVRKIQTIMENELISAGLIGDQSMEQEILDTTTASMQSGTKAVQNGACTRMTPASRARLRAMVAALMN